METKSIQCSKCGETAEHDETNDPNEIAGQTGFTLIENGWLCPDCTSDHFNTEGC
jgi:rubredoxin